MGIESIVAGAKTALDIANTLQNVDLKAAILDLKEEILALREENIALKEQLQKQSDIEMVFENNCYWIKDENGTKEGPYCSVCWDKSKSAIRLTNSYANQDFYKCGNCNNDYCVHNIDRY